MSTRELRQLLEHVGDTREIVLPAAPAAADELRAVWHVARAEANLALQEWRRRPGEDRYRVYRAAEDRADAAQDALASAAVASGARPNVTQRTGGLN